LTDADLTDRLGHTRALEVAKRWADARAIYSELWNEATRSGDQYQACIVAHFMAHTHDESQAQLIWHLRALQAADVAAAQGDYRVRDFYPSLHANLGDVYMRLGRCDRARAHIDAAREADSLLPDDAYGGTVRYLIDRLEREVKGEPPS
jgi:hypothetical protein